MNHFSITDLFSLLCGIALFLYGMQQGEKNLKRLGGARLRQIIGAVTRHRLAAYVTGFVTTLFTQSSSATTVMLVGLASVQLMTLRQALGVILGSDLGTTVTLSLFVFKFYLVAPLLIAAGFTMAFIRKSGTPALVGKLVLAAGFVFYGMGLMAGSSESLRSYPFVMHLLQASFSNPWIGIAAGILVTAVIHNSAATLAITIGLAEHFTFANGTTPGLADLFPIVLGANIGTCSTAFLALLQAETEGVRVACAHLTFKVTGSLLALPAIWLLPHLSFASSWPVAYQIAALHTVFNLYIGAIFLPLLSPVDRTIRRMVAGRQAAAQRFHTEFLNEKVVQFPVLAISQSVKEIVRMSGIAVKMVEDSVDLIRKHETQLNKKIAEADDEIDFLYGQIMAFLTRSGREEMGDEDASRAHELIMVATDIEHIGDIASKSLTMLAEKMAGSPVPLSAEGKQEIVDFLSATAQLLHEALAAFAAGDREQAAKIYGQKPLLKEKFESLIECHMQRLYRHKVESLQTTSIHVDLLEEIQRINHFSFRIAAHMLKIQ